MVSVRKAWRKLMGLSPGRGASLGQRLELPYGSNPPTRFPQCINSVSVYTPPSEAEQRLPVTFSSSSMFFEQRDQRTSGVKRRKPHKRKKVSRDRHRQPCLMRGVYFKNMKWQAAIKVEKKQIHLGTVETQEEAAHLYDRAAFMCGREPNFDLSEEEMEELMKLNWDEFLDLTRHTISNKKHRRRREAGIKNFSAPVPPLLSDGIDAVDDEHETSNTSASED